MRWAALLLILLCVPVAAADVVDDARDADVIRDWAEAADLWARVLAEQPGEREAAFGLARAVREGKRWEHFAAAEKALGALHEADENDAEARLALGRLFLERAPTVAHAVYRATFYARAKTHFGALVTADPTDETATIGLARGNVGTGHAEQAIEVLDAYLGHNPEKDALALLWKARILYDQGKAKHKAAGGGYPLSPEVSRLYGRAQGAALSSTAGDPMVFDAWMHVAWTSVVLGDRESATKAYERAYSLDPESPLPLRGLVSLNAHDAVAKAKALERLRRLAPERRRERLKEAYAILAEARWDDLDAFIQEYLAEFGDDADGYYLLGRAHGGRYRTREAKACFVRALELDSSHLAAAEELDRRVRKNVHERARNSVASARGVYENYAILMRLAPRNPFVRNNAAFALREAWAHHKSDPNWREIILLSARIYEQAARLVGRRRPDENPPWSTRYAYAQMVCDAGLIFHMYEQISDPKRAERYLVRALEWSDHGYLDAWTYLRELLQKQSRWQELHDVALRCADGLADAAEKPLEKERKAARELALLLEKDGRATASE